MAVYGKIGFRVRTDVPRADPDLVAQFRSHATSNIADAMGRFHFMDPGIRARSGLPLCGVAVTVDARPADNLMIHKALEVATPGDIIVVSTNGNTTSAIFGELMCRTAVGASLGGIVVDGAIRDIDGITALAFPAYSRAVCAGGCDKDGPGEVNSPISCGNTVVMPGDIIVGDDEGIVVIPQHLADEVAEQAVEQEKMEVFILERVQGGARLPGTYPPNAETKAAFEVWRKERGV